MKHVSIARDSSLLTSKTCRGVQEPVCGPEALLQLRRAAVLRGGVLASGLVKVPSYKLFLLLVKPRCVYATQQPVGDVPDVVRFRGQPPLLGRAVKGHDDAVVVEADVQGVAEDAVPLCVRFKSNFCGSPFPTRTSQTYTAGRPP